MSMPMSLRKQSWWMVLASCCGIGAMLVIPLVGILVSLPDKSLIWSGVILTIVLFLGEIGVGLLAVRKLKACYADEPLEGGGRWQLTLSDMIAIVFFFGTVMLLCQVISPAGFMIVGIPISLISGVGFVAAMFVVARTETLATTWERCFVAFSFMWFGLIFTVISVLIQVAALAVVAGLLRLAFML
jgi:hypothetical protein